MAASIHLALLTKYTHWNLRGPNFIAVDEMLDSSRGQLDEHVDTMAERIVQLGGTALGTLQSVGGSIVLKPYQTNIDAQKDHLNALADRFGEVANSVRININHLDDAGDANSTDVLALVASGSFGRIGNLHSCLGPSNRRLGGEKPEFPMKIFVLRRSRGV